MATLVRALRYVTDPVAPFSFNRMGFDFNQRGFDPEDIPEHGDGRVAVVTGAGSGIGYATSLALAERGWEVWLGCRDKGRGEEARSDIARASKSDRVHLALVDVSELSSVRAFAEALPVKRIDALVHNAGVLPDKRTLTSDGVELTFATHVLGPFALTAQLMPRLLSSSDGRMIFVASGGLYAQKLDLDMLDVDAARFDGTMAYANAKRAQVILTHMFAERLGAAARVTFASMHPGWADTRAVRTSLPRFYETMKGVLRTPEQGADTVVWLAASERPRGTRGQFWFDRRVALEHPLPWTRERKTAREQLWERCEALSGVAFPTVGAA
jgi:dehydrogenase/reductase SDR family protein 12